MSKGGFAQISLILILPGGNHGADDGRVKLMIKPSSSLCWREWLQAGHLVATLSQVSTGSRVYPAESSRGCYRSPDRRPTTWLAGQPAGHAAISTRAKVLRRESSWNTTRSLTKETSYLIWFNDIDRSCFSKRRPPTAQEGKHSLRIQSYFF